MATMVKVFARVVGPNGEAPALGLRAKLWDKDAVSDDFLAEAEVSADGRVEFLFELESASSADSPLESEPDLYVVLSRDGQEVHRTAVQSNVAFLAENPVTGFRDNVTRDLGTIHLAR